MHILGKLQLIKNRICIYVSFIIFRDILLHFERKKIWFSLQNVKTTRKAYILKSKEMKDAVTKKKKSFDRFRTNGTVIKEISGCVTHYQNSER